MMPPKAPPKVLKPVKPRAPLFCQLPTPGPGSYEATDSFSPKKKKPAILTAEEDDDSAPPTPYGLTGSLSASMFQSRRMSIHQATSGTDAIYNPLVTSTGGAPLGQRKSFRKIPDVVVSARTPVRPLAHHPQARRDSQDDVSYGHGHYTNTAWKPTGPKFSFCRAPSVSFASASAAPGPGSYSPKMEWATPPKPKKVRPPRARTQSMIARQVAHSRQPTAASSVRKNTRRTPGDEPGPADYVSALRRPPRAPTGRCTFGTANRFPPRKLPEEDEAPEPGPGSYDFELTRVNRNEKTLRFGTSS